jgi:MFS family permease
MKDKNFCSYSMLKNIISDIEISKSNTLNLVIMFVSVFSSMYLYHLFLIEDLLKIYFVSWENIFLGKALFYISLSISQVIGSKISDYIKRKKLILSSVTLTIIILFMSYLFHSKANILIFSFLIGASYGLILPSCFAMLVDLTKIEERGRISGLIVFSIFFFLIVLIYIPSIFSFNTSGYQILSIVVLFVSYFILSNGIFELLQVKKGTISYKEIITSKQYLLYLIY